MKLRAEMSEEYVFSTLVEVFLGYKGRQTLHGCLLHARGGVSEILLHIMTPPASSPRSWRCFSVLTFSASVKLVFSTLVEVFLNGLGEVGNGKSLLHARGGVSMRSCAEAKFYLSSPRSWRCFHGHRRRWANNVVFSTLVEVFLAWY